MNLTKMTPEDKQAAIKSGKVIYLKPSEHICPCCGAKFIIKDGEETCPNCNAKVISISRITGYLSFDTRFCESKVNERQQRVSHNNDNHEQPYCK